MGLAAGAGAVYFALIFTLGFVLGTLRVTFLIPLLGETPSVLLELPVILLACWVVSGRLVKRALQPGARGEALVMGGTAFALLMVTELALGVVAFERTVAQQIEQWLALAGALGLAGQVAFALFPWIHMHRQSL